MINKHELMMGNCVLDEFNQVVRVESIDDVGINGFEDADGKFIKGYDEFDKINPILITEDILSKAGFEKHKNSNEYWSFWKLSNNWHINQAHHTEPSAGVEEGKFYFGEEYLEVKSMHQLQNLLFILTGKQLKIELLKGNLYR